MTVDKTTRRSRSKLGLAWWLGVLALAIWAPSASADLSDYGLETVGASTSTTQAGAHPDLTIAFSTKLDPNGEPWARTKEVKIDLPQGFVANPAAFPRCPMREFANLVGGFGGLGGGVCPQDSQIGTVLLTANTLPTANEPLYVLEPPADGDVVARFGFIGVLYPFVIDFRVRPGDNGVTADAAGSGQAQIITVTTTTWGVPTDPSHDGSRMAPIEVTQCGGPCNGARPSGLAPTAFVTNPTSCLGTQDVDISAASFPAPDTFDSKTATLPPNTGCNQVPFNPSIDFAPTSTEAGSPTGLDITMNVPQDGLTNPSLLGSSHVKGAVVTMPEGITLNPAAADQLDACTPGQIGLVSTDPIVFDGSDPTCPDGSK